MKDKQDVAPGPKGPLVERGMYGVQASSFNNM